MEENILKKANQKRMLGDMAIEGGNFTTAFFKQVEIINKIVCVLKTHFRVIPKYYDLISDTVLT